MSGSILVDIDPSGRCEALLLQRIYCEDLAQATSNG